MAYFIICDSFAPLNTSAAIQMQDLCEEMAHQGQEVIVLTPYHGLDKNYKTNHNHDHNIKILYFKTFGYRDKSKIKRFFGEIILPFYMIFKIIILKEKFQKIDGIIWYSPTIFFGPLIKFLKKKYKCKTYLIVRDIFPDWALDMGLINNGLRYAFLKYVANYQYKLANTIGVQSSGNLVFFEKFLNNKHQNVEILNNWLRLKSRTTCSIDLQNTILARKKIFIYSGNMGIAQCVSVLTDLAYNFRDNSDVGFLFIGRGSELPALKKFCLINKLDNVLFIDEINSEEIPALYDQCHVGLISLDSRHKSHNIPGKFISYIRSGLPVVALVNKDNDLIDLINSKQVGEACSNKLHLKQKAVSLLQKIDHDKNHQERCVDLYVKNYTAKAAVSQIMKSFN